MKNSIYILFLASIFSFISCNNSSSNNQNAQTEKVVFEVVAVSLKNGVTMEELLKADKEMEINFVSKQKGFISREVAVSKNGKDLFVIVRWDNLENAENAAKGFMTDTYAQKRMQLADMKLFDHYLK